MAGSAPFVVLWRRRIAGSELLFPLPPFPVLLLDMPESVAVGDGSMGITQRVACCWMLMGP
ncbi:MAG: hypothetical protein TQ37_07325 [Candidatus Synechococcus spongiarum 15L]|uniref:Uncharacterized protein n=1 Tax=Candidatus Synechococcus spongiarum 15L TaxID=1608419 RepID=A0A0G8ATD2_9SYNE|nr:MAG: hypothetical protein TQ37_07325 [Candidatus Synechococcus spongiarum 15L]